MCDGPGQIVYNGVCYDACPSGYEPVNDTDCKANCPFGFQSNDSFCVRPVLARESVPPIDCPTGATRVYDHCLLACPEGTVAKFELCVPVCPPGFTESVDGLSCLSELFPRISTIRDACYQGETRSGAFCLRPCPPGSAVYSLDQTLCYKVLPSNLTDYFATYGTTSAKIYFQRTVVGAVCPQGFVAQDNTCYAPCPKGSTGDHAYCYVNCPAQFPELSKGLACQRPVRQRTVVTSAFDAIGTYVKYFLTGIGVLIFIVLVFFGLSFVRKIASR